MEFFSNCSSLGVTNGIHISVCPSSCIYNLEPILRGQKSVSASLASYIQRG